MGELPDPSTVQVSVDIGSLPTFLSSLVEQLKASQDRIAALETTVTALTAQLAQEREDKKQDVEKLQSELSETRKKMEEIGNHVGELENLDPKNQREKISDFQATLANLVERVGASEVCASHAQAALVDMRNRIDQLANRSQEISDHVKTLDHSAASANTRLHALEQRQGEMAGSMQEISDIQSAELSSNSNFQKMFKTEISDKIERLQKQLSRELSESLKNMSTEAVAPKNPKISDQQLLNNMVSAAQKAIASALGARAQRNFQVRVVDVWRQTAGEGGKRRVAVRLLNRVLGRTIDRSIFSVWRDKVGTARLRRELETAISGKIPSADKILGEYPARIASLDAKFSGLETAMEQQSKTHLQEQQETQTNIGRANQELQSLSAVVTGLSGKTDDKYKPQFEFLASEASRVSGELAELKKTVDADYATNKDLQKLMTDVLLLWNSMKQLDATKADRTELDRLATEWNHKVAEVMKNADDLLHALDALKLKLNTSVSAPASAVAPSAATATWETSEVVARLQQQVAVIAQYLFDLVGRLAAMRGIDASKLPVFPVSLMPGSTPALPVSLPIPPPIPAEPGTPGLGGQPRSRSSFGSATGAGISDLQQQSNTTELLRYARSLVTAAGGSRSPQNSRRELILPADLRLDGAPFRRVNN